MSTRFFTESKVSVHTGISLGALGRSHQKKLLPATQPNNESMAAQIRNRRTALTAEELAELLALSRRHIYKLAKKGRMPSLSIGGAIRFDPDSTANWLEGKSIASPTG